MADQCESRTNTPQTAAQGSADATDVTSDGHTVISARKARSAGLGIENKRSGLRFAAAASVAVLLLIVVAVVTSLTA